MTETPLKTTIDPSVPAAPRLWTAEGFRDDEWRHVTDAENISATNAQIILPLAEFEALGEQARNQLEGRLGVLIAPGESLDAILPHLASLRLIALAFPAYNDGRSYSKATLLRERHGFEGAIRATGDVLIDQIPHMLRLGFDELEIKNPTALKRLEEGRVGGISQHYQPTVASDDKVARFAWRRQV